MPDTVGQWVAVVEELYPPAHAADWDRVGLQIGDPTWPVERVLVTLDVTTAVIAEAADGPPTLVVSHHPPLFRPLERLTPDTPAGAVALAAARARVAVCAAHTNLDVATDGAGTSDPVVRLLGLEDVTPLARTAADGPGFGRVGRLPEPLTLRALAARIREGLPAPHLRVAGNTERLVRQVAVVGGAGDSFIDAAVAAGADVYITGDLRHHVALDALERGLALIDAGHHATEQAAVPVWRDRLEEAGRARGLTAEVVASEVPTDPWWHQR